MNVAGLAIVLATACQLGGFGAFKNGSDSSSVEMLLCSRLLMRLVIWLIVMALCFKLDASL